MKNGQIACIIDVGKVLNKVYTGEYVLKTEAGYFSLKDGAEFAKTPGSWIDDARIRICRPGDRLIITVVK